MSSEVINLQTYYVKKTDIIDNLTTDDATKILSAKQGKKLQDDKVNKAQGIANANMNVITDASGNITVGELSESSSFVDTLAKLYSDNTEHTINQSSVNNNHGRRHFDLLFTTEDDVYVSCLFQQTNIGNWYSGGLVVTTEEPVTETTEVNNNGGSVLITAGTGNTTSTSPGSYYGQSSSTCPFRGVEGLEANNYITFGTWYKFEVYRIGTKYTTIITNTDTGNVVLSQSKEITGNYKYWAMHAYEGCKITYKDVVINKIAISGFLTNNVANIELPTKTSDLTNDGADGVNAFITSTNLPTKTSDLTNDGEGVINKPFLTEHQDISGKANTSDLATVATSGSYNDLTNKPSIPDISGKANSVDLATVATSGSYNDLVNKPSIPDSTEDLINDSGFITASDIPESVDLTGYVQESDLATVATSGSYNDLTNKPDIPEGADLTDYINNTKLVEVIDYATDDLVEDTTIQIICDSNIPYAENSTFEVKGTLFGPGRLSNLPIKLYIDDTLESTQNTNYNGDVVFNIDMPSVGTDIEIKLIFEGNDIYNTVTEIKDVSIIDFLTIEGALGRNYYPNASDELVLTVTSSYTDNELGDMKLYLNNGLFSSNVHKGDTRISGEMLNQIGHGSDIIVRLISTVKNKEATVTITPASSTKREVALSGSYTITA